MTQEIIANKTISAVPERILIRLTATDWKIERNKKRGIDKNIRDIFNSDPELMAEY
jgi:hypothetical protein